MAEGPQCWRQAVEWLRERFVVPAPEGRITLPEKSSCRHCGEPIMHWVSDLSDVWLHTRRTHAWGADKCLGAPRVAEPVDPQ